MTRKDPLVLIITDESDPAVEPLVEELDQIGSSSRILSRDRYGIDWSFTWTSNSRSMRCVLEHCDGDVLALDATSAFLRRDFTGPVLHIGQDVNEQEYLEQQKAIHVNAVYRWLSDCIPFMNSPMNNLRMMSKMLQTKMALECGFRTPETFVGSSPDEAVQFQVSTDGPLCKKPIEAVRLSLADGSRAVHMTSMFERKTAVEFESLRDCPVVLQRFVQKFDELRVMAVGDEVLACRIDTSNASEDAQVDFRHYDWANTPHEAIELDETTKGGLRKFMKMSGLTYGAFDLLRESNGEFTFLEVNPMGQWLWVEDLTGLPVTREIARWLSNPY